MPEQPLTLLQQIEREVLAEAEEFARKRLTERLQELADTRGEISPPQPASAGAPTTQTAGGAKRRRRH